MELKVSHLRVLTHLVWQERESITGDVIDLTNRLEKVGVKIKKIDFISCDRRIHNANYGRTNQADEYKDYAKLLRERLGKK